MKNTLSKSERLSSESRLNALFAGGHRGSVDVLRFCWTATATANDRIGVSETGVSVLFSVPKKVFKRAWKRNLIKRRMRESYRQRKHALASAAHDAGLQIDIALICSPPTARTAPTANAGTSGMTAPKNTPKSARKRVETPEIPDFKTIDDAIAKILEKIRSRN